MCCVAYSACFLDAALQAALAPHDSLLTNAKAASRLVRFKQANMNSLIPNRSVGGEKKKP